MKTLFSFLSILAICTFFFACKKETHTSSNQSITSSSIVGVWKAQSGVFTPNGITDTTWNLLPLNDTLTIDTGHYFSVNQYGYGFYDGYYTYANDTIMASQSGYYPMAIQVVSVSSNSMVLVYGVYMVIGGSNPQFDLGTITYAKL